MGGSGADLVEQVFTELGLSFFVSIGTIPGKKNPMHNPIMAKTNWPAMFHPLRGQNKTTEYKEK